MASIIITSIVANKDIINYMKNQRRLTLTLLYNNKSRSQLELALNEDQFIDFIKTLYNSLFFTQYIHAIKALHGSSIISSLTICVLLTFIIKALVNLKALLIRVILFINFNALNFTLLRFYPRLIIFIISSFNSGELLLLF